MRHKARLLLSDLSLLIENAEQVRQPFLLYRQDRAFRMADHPVHLAAQQKTLQDAKPAGAHDDQVAIITLSYIEDAFGRRSKEQLIIYRNITSNNFPCIL